MLMGEVAVLDLYAYMQGVCYAVVCHYITRRGQASRCLSLDRGNAKA